ncbi:hypothetical protein B0H16DRAFT_709978 [Mycena metata]|uniref:Hydrophobin n=1 Tax=Mycena metata TaxID=1033252 RepID=A0AAD7GTZ0_9AGAR|nr:hypothetical protein B0H16DRAFT_709978 [Mycena metata]
MTGTVECQNANGIKEHQVLSQSHLNSTVVQANMFSQLAAVVASVLVTLAAATPTGTPPPPLTPPTSPQCCESVELPTSAHAIAIAGLLGIDLTGLNASVPIGIGCNWFLLPNTCSGMNLECDAPDNEWGGLIAFNCIPATV